MKGVLCVTKNVLVTGACGGLGSAAVRSFLARGDRVFVTDRPEAPLASLTEDLGREGWTVASAAADIRDSHAVRKVAEASVDEMGSLDVLVHAAGGSHLMLTREPNKPLWELTPENWQLVIDVNLYGSINWVVSAAEVMKKQRDGAIVLVASGTGVRPGKNMASYAAAKAGVLGLMKAAAVELGEYNIRVNAVNPGMMLHDRMPALSPGWADGYLAQTTLGRLSTPEEVGAFICSIVDQEAMSGQVLNLDSRYLH